MTGAELVMGALQASLALVAFVVLFVAVRKEWS